MEKFKRKHRSRWIINAKNICFLLLVFFGSTGVAQAVPGWLKKGVEQIVKGVEQIGDAGQQVLDKAVEVAEHAAEQVKNAPDWAKEKAREAERVAKEKLIAAEKKLRQSLEAVAEYPITIAEKVGNTIRNVTVKAGESLKDAVERAEKNLDHLSTPSFRQYQVLERNISKIQAIKIDLKIKIDDLKIKKGNLPVLSSKVEFLNKVKTNFDLGKITSPTFPNPKFGWNDFDLDVNLQKVVSQAGKAVAKGISDTLSSVGREISSAGVWIDDTVFSPVADPLSQAGRDFNQWVINESKAPLKEVDRWDDYWIKKGQEVKRLSWKDVESEWGRFSTWVEARLGTNTCQEDGDVIIQGDRNTINCLDKEIRSITASIDILNGLNFDLSVSFKNQLMAKINLGRNFLQTELGVDLGPNPKFGLTAAKVPLASLNATEEKLICNGDLAANIPDDKTLDVIVERRFFFLPSEFDTGDDDNIGFRDIETTSLAYSKCQQFPVKGLAMTHDGRRFGFESTLYLQARYKANATARHLLLANSSNGDKEVFNLADADMGTVVITSEKGGGGGSGSTIDPIDIDEVSKAGEQSFKIEKEARQRKIEDLGDARQKAESRNSQCSNLISALNIVNKDLLEIEPRQILNSEMSSCIGSDVGALGMDLVSVQGQIRGRMVMSQSLAYMLGQSALQRNGGIGFDPTACRNVVGLGVLLDEMSVRPNPVTAEILDRYVKGDPTRVTDPAAIAAVGCWAQRYQTLTSDVKTFQAAREFLRASKTMASGIGRQEIIYQIATERERSANLREQVNALRPDLHPEVKRKINALDSADLALDFADVAQQEQDIAAAREATNWAREVLDFVADAIPVASQIKSAIALATGINPITNKPLDSVDYAFEAINLIDLAGVTKMASKTARIAQRIVENRGRSRVIAEKVLEAIKTVDRQIVGQKLPCSVSLAIVDCDTIAKTVGQVTDEVVDAAKRAGFKSQEELAQVVRGAPSVTTQMEAKILRGEVNGKGALIGGHSPSILNDSAYQVEILATNTDGTMLTKVTKKIGDAVLFKENHTLFPNSWGDEKIVSVTRYLSGQPANLTRAADGTTLHRGIVDGVEVFVLKKDGFVTSAYPTGGGGRLPGGF